MCSCPSYKERHLLYFLCNLSLCKCIFHNSERLFSLSVLNLDLLNSALTLRAGSNHQERDVDHRVGGPTQKNRILEQQFCKLQRCTPVRCNAQATLPYSLFLCILTVLDSRVFMLLLLLFLNNYRLK